MIKKLLAISAVIFTSVLFTACGSNNNLIRESYEKRKPLSEEDKLRVAIANEIPVIPENAVPIATIVTDPESQCSVDDALRYLTMKARELGANFLYVKAVEDRIVVHHYGFFMSSKRCKALYADFMEVK